MGSTALFPGCRHSLGASLTLPPRLPSSGAVTPVRTCGRRIAVEAGPSRTQTPLSSAGGRASARRCRSRRTKAARCTASWRSTRYRRSPGGTGQLGCGLAPSTVTRGHTCPQGTKDKGKGGSGWRMRGHLPPGGRKLPLCPREELPAVPRAR